MNISAIHFFDPAWNYMATMVERDAPLSDHYAQVLLYTLSGEKIEHDFWSGDEAEEMLESRLQALNSIQSIRESAREHAQRISGAQGAV